MTLGEERELEKIKDCLSYVLVDKHSDAPHWDAAYPWKANPAILPDNRRAVDQPSGTPRLDWKENLYGKWHMESRSARLYLEEQPSSSQRKRLRAGTGRSGTSAIWSPRILILAQRQ